MDDETCACGHVLDEHDPREGCQVDECPCGYFDAGTEEP